MKRFLPSYRNERKFVSRFLLAMFVLSCAAVFGVSLYSRSTVAFLVLEMENNIQARLKETSLRGAAMVSTEELEAYQKPEDMNLPGYQALRRRLAGFASESGVLFVYYLRPSDSGKFQYIIDNDFDEATRVGLDTPPKEIESTPGLGGALSGQVESPPLGSYMEGWEGLLSAYAPMFDAIGQVVAVCGVDINDESIVRATEREKRLGLLEIAAVVVVLASGIFSFLGYVGEARAAREAKESIISGIEYASKIQKNLLPLEEFFREAFADYHIIWKPKDIVGGDIYWIKNFDEGTILCVCDCTGHGTPGALLTMLVVSTFEASVNEANFMDTAQIIWELEARLVSMLGERENVETSVTLNDGCDLAVLFIAKDGAVRFSSGAINVFVCDGESVTRHKGQRIRVGDGNIRSKEEIKVVSIPADKDKKFYIASDGLYEQIGGLDKIPFGYDALSKIILENHNMSLCDIGNKIWRAFEDYRGANPRRDDFEIVSFRTRTKDVK